MRNVIRSLLAALAAEIRRRSGATYEALKPDRVVERKMRLDDGRSFVGDMMLGRYLGGALMPQRAGEHHFHADRQHNLGNIQTLLKGPGKLFYLGHGGPVTRESIVAAFGSGEPEPTLRDGK